MVVLQFYLTIKERTSVKSRKKRNLSSVQIMYFYISYYHYLKFTWFNSVQTAKCPKVGKATLKIAYKEQTPLQKIKWRGLHIYKFEVLFYSKKSFKRLLREGWRNLRSAFASI